MLGQFGKLLRAVADGRDPASIPPPSEVIATLSVSSLRRDWLYPQDSYLYGGTAKETAAVNRAVVALYNPGDSDALCLVTGFHARADNDSLLLYMMDDADVSPMDSDGLEFAKDPRVQFTTGGTNFGRTPTCRVLSDDAVAAGQQVERIVPTAEGAAHYYYQFPHNSYVLTPGSAIGITSAANAATVAVSFEWIERHLPPAELRGIDPRILT